MALGIYLTLLVAVHLLSRDCLLRSLLPKSYVLIPAWSFDLQDLPCNGDILAFGLNTLFPRVFYSILTAQTLTASLCHTISLKQELIFLVPRLGLSLWEYLAVNLIPEFSLALTILWNCPGFRFLPYDYYRKSSFPLTIKDFFVSKHVKVPWKQTFIHSYIKNDSPGTTILTTVLTNNIVTLSQWFSYFYQ